MEEYMRRFLYYAVAFAVICGVFFGFLKAADYAGVNDAESVRRYTFHDYYAQENIDVLFIGSSQAFFSVDCGIMDEKLEKNTFDMGSASQRLNLTSFLLKDAAKRYDLDHVYIYLGYRQAKYTSDKVGSTILSYISDGLRSMPDKLRLIIRYTEPDQYMNLLLPVRRNLKALFSPNTVMATLRVKSGDAYRNYDSAAFITGSETYGGKGHVMGNTSVEDGTLVSTFTPYPLKISAITDTWKSALQEIVEFCKAEDIDVTFFAPPLSSCVLLAMKDQDSFIREVRSMLEGTGFEYVDFSLLKEEYWPDTSTIFQDGLHLNQSGAEIFTKVFADYINGEIAEDEIFYGSVEERFKNLDPAFYGASVRETKRKGTEYHLIGNPAEKIEYKVDLEPGDGQVIPLQDFDKNDCIYINDGTPGVLRVSARLEGETEVLSESVIELE